MTLKDYLKNLLCAFPQFLNAIFGGNIGEEWIGTILEVWYFTDIVSTTDLSILHRNQGAYYGIAVI
jgi:hypothetical protein